MGRRIHTMLSYESRERKKYNLLVPYLSNLLYDLEDVLGKDRVAEVVWTYSIGITFRDLTEKEFKAVKKVMKADTLKKEISRYGVKFVNPNYSTGLFVDNKEVTLSIEFKWDLPDTCELVYKDKWDEIEPSDVKIEDGKFLHKSVEVEVNCGEKEMMKAIFKPQVVSKGV